MTLRACLLVQALVVAATAPACTRDEAATPPRAVSVTAPVDQAAPTPATAAAGPAVEATETETSAVEPPAAAPGAATDPLAKRISAADPQLVGDALWSFVDPTSWLADPPPPKPQLYCGKDARREGRETLEGYRDIEVFEVECGRCSWCAVAGSQSCTYNVGHHSQETLVFRPNDAGELRLWAVLNESNPGPDPDYDADAANQSDRAFSRFVEQARRDRCRG